jgi:site-specific DNA-methyltransferase (adenine-specific)
MNKIYLGDNLEWLKEVQDESIDMCYIDPPFFTQRQLIDNKTKISFNDKFESSKAYIEWMRPRIELIHKKLKKTGSIFLHCDWHASHRLRVLLDDVFGEENFINEIIWCYKSGGASKKYFSNKHDTIFFYSKSNNYYFNPIKEKSYMGLDYNTGNKNVILFDDNDGKGKYTLVYMKDWWLDIGMLATSSFERVGYPTQKPEKLLKRIIECSTNEGDVILDCFAGSGTTAKVAKDLNRQFIVGDVSEESINLIRRRLNG